jgi:hypothetical protein
MMFATTSDKKDGQQESTSKTTPLRMQGARKKPKKREEWCVVRVGCWKLIRRNPLTLAEE